MDPVSGLNQLMQVLRQKLSERPPAIAKKQTASANTTADASTKVSVDAIKRKIGARIKTLPDGEAASTQAAQIFVEAVMTWEFGDQLLQDPQFSQLAKDVVKAMAENPKVWRQLQTSLNELRP